MPDNGLLSTLLEVDYYLRTLQDAGIISGRIIRARIAKAISQVHGNDNT